MKKSDSLIEHINKAPAVFDAAGTEALTAVLAPRFDELPTAAQNLIKATAGCSPYLRRVMQRHPELVFSILHASPASALENAIRHAQKAASVEDKAQQMQILRAAKAEAALAIGLADIAGAWDVMQAAAALSRFADAAVEAALGAALLRSPLQSVAGVAIIAMGKHGAFELNYSSDIDLIVLFDSERMGLAESIEAQAHAVKLVRTVVDLLQAQTADGYVFRTDLRLRPDPGVSAVAISASAAEAYYEAYGQNWERMAFIKARACAGDIDFGENILSVLRPFIWRKYLDFAAIEDVHAVKRQIHAVKGGGAIEFEGHDIKLGRGGIREIEFYAQTQQLILGGKNSALRARATLDALAALKAFGHISEASCETMSSAYRYFRFIEHRLQMINDEQTHRLPRRESDLERLAVFAGEKCVENLRRNMVGALRRTHDCYASLFEIDGEAEVALGTLVFTGVEDHPATLETLEGLGFSRATDISETIRRWHKGGLRATRTERARNLLTKLVPALLGALSKANNPDDAFFAFEAFLSRLPSGVQVFSLLLNNLDVFDALIRIMTISPYLGRELSRRHNFIERLLENDWATAPAISTYDAACDAAVAAADDYEQALNLVRRWAGEQKFQIAAQLAVGLAPYKQAARHFSAIADACIRTLAPAALKEMQRQHGVIAGGLSIIGLGRLGAEEMTASSDIDIMFVYDAPRDIVSDGARPLGPVDYYTRLVRRIVTGLSAATEEGALYEVDMQLRPSGRSGPAAVSLSAFRNYYEKDAWLWEVMALVKARVITQDAYTDTVAREIDKILRRARDKGQVAAAVSDMRGRLLEAKPGAGPWDVKANLGGLTDIAFLTQFLALASADRLGPPPRDVGEAVLWFAARGELAQEKATTLERAHSVYEAILQTGRAATGGVFAPEKAGDALIRRMTALCEKNTIDSAEEALTGLQSNVTAIFKDVLQQPYGKK